MARRIEGKHPPPPHHATSSFPDIDVQIPFKFDNESLSTSFISSICDCSWNTVYNQISKFLKVQPHQLIIRIQSDSDSHVLFPFQPISSGLSDIFDPTTGVFNRSHHLIYQVVSEKIRASKRNVALPRASFIDDYVSRLTFFKGISEAIVEQITTLQKNISSALSSAGISCLLPKVLELLCEQFSISSVDKPMISTLKHTLSQTLVSVMMPHVSETIIHFDFKVNTWNVLAAWIKNLQVPACGKVSLDFEEENIKKATRNDDI